ncbi:hypothetical protein HMPREF9081_1335 [Centipeda periodontii DSM 2778]|uniref:Uncharacterized protein n=1 Tax=Centipeda periodontii DSM 2778 TaxID=888060 RepID=F5RM49_9FIRM|nr:hypothetical protein HMPREF9081_1335 [Centipeda periodontii DSM 2778]
MKFKMLRMHLPSLDTTECISRRMLLRLFLAASCSLFNKKLAA